jgi:hypothetical protein
MEHLLEAEVQTYEKNRGQLVSKSEGKFVLIHGAEVAGVFESKIDAIKVGHQRFGRVPILVRQICSVDRPPQFASNLFQI